MFCIQGELDPERMGSGIQYGDGSLRRLQKQKTKPRPDCACQQLHTLWNSYCVSDMYIPQYNIVEVTILIMYRTPVCNNSKAEKNEFILYTNWGFQSVGNTTCAMKLHPLGTCTVSYAGHMLLKKYLRTQNDKPMFQQTRALFLSKNGGSSVLDHLLCQP